jgi:tripartite-type tricarboxylate transporter receptor subunit TctC
MNSPHTRDASRRGFLRTVAGSAIAGAMAGSGLAHAAAYPDKPVRIILPFAVGGSADAVARLLANKLGERLRQPFVIEAKLGANGTIAADYVAKSAPDGYTLLLNSSAQAINPTLYTKLPFDPVHAFAPVAQVVQPGPFVIVVSPQLPVRDLRELVAYAKAKPGAVSYGSAGIGNSLHLGGEMLAQAAGIELLHVPYKGAASIVNDLVGGQIQLMFNSWLAVQPFVESGKLRAVAQTGLQRSPAMPDIPTMAESGCPGFEFTSWFGLWAPAGTPAAIVDMLNAETRWAMGQPDVLERMAPMGTGAPQPLSPAEFGRFTNAEVERYARVIRKARITLDS